MKVSSMENCNNTGILLFTYIFIHIYISLYFFLLSVCMLYCFATMQHCEKQYRKINRVELISNNYIYFRERWPFKAWKPSLTLAMLFLQPTGTTTSWTGTACSISYQPVLPRCHAGDGGRGLSHHNSTRRETPTHSLSS